MEEDRRGEREVARARRKLLKIAVYTPPAILGTLLISRDALAQPVSPCQPSRPCKPAPCGPQPCGPAPCGPSP